MPFETSLWTPEDVVREKVGEVWEGSLVHTPGKTLRQAAKCEFLASCKKEIKSELQ